MPLHITLSKLVFTSHCICFYYIMICPVSSDTPLISFRLDDPNALSVDFEQVIISVIMFTVLFANQIMIFSTSVVHVPLVLSCLVNPSALASDFEQVIVSVICFLVTCFLPCLLAGTDLFHISRKCVTGFVSFAFTVCWLTLNRSLFQFYCIWHC